MHLPEAAAGAGEILGGGVDDPAVDPAEAGDDAVGVDLLLAQSEEGRAVLDEELALLERSRIEQEVDPFPGGQFALLMLLLDHLFAAHGDEPVLPFHQIRRSSLTSSFP